MNILINASNLKAGGAIQVTDSICRELYRFPQYEFVVVLSSYFIKTKDALSSISNVKKVLTYNVKNNISTLLFGRDRILDKFVKDNNVDVALTIFGPSRWNPKCPHLSGCAFSFLVLPESPYYKRMSLQELIIAKLKNFLWSIYLRRSTKFFYTENPLISSRLERLLLFRGCTVFTVTNNYNQIYDHNELWDCSISLPKFDGISLIYITAGLANHKNVNIMIAVSDYLEKNKPDFKFRFVLSLTEHEFYPIPQNLRKHFVFIGRLTIEQCPCVYKQCDIMFMPSLLECFSATYPEAMKMGLPIITTDLAFAHGICRDAACYYDALSAQSAAEAIIKVSSDKNYHNSLVSAGKTQLQMFDTYQTRADKLISHLVSLKK